MNANIEWMDLILTHSRLGHFENMVYRKAWCLCNTLAYPRSYLVFIVFIVSPSVKLQPVNPVTVCIRRFTCAAPVMRYICTAQFS